MRLRLPKTSMGVFPWVRARRSKRLPFSRSGGVLWGEFEEGLEVGPDGGQGAGLEGVDVGPAVVLGDLDGTPAGEEAVAREADRGLREVGLEHGGQAAERLELAVLLALLFAGGGGCRASGQRAAAPTSR